MKKIFTLVFVALLVSTLGAGTGKKTIYKQLDVIVFHPDSLVSMRADAMVWGSLWLIQSDSTDTMSMTPDKMTIDSITITDYLHCTDDVRFDSTLYFTDGGADTSSIVQDGTNLKFASDNPFAMSRQLTFVEDVDRTGEGTILFANAIPIGMATPGDCQGMKTEFKYGVTPTLTGGGKVIQGLMLKMTMDKKWKFASANRNADVRAIGVQAELNDSLGGVLSAIYANAYTDIATDKQIIGEHTTGAYGVGMCAIEARTEIKGAGVLTVPHIAGLYVLHRRMGSGGVTGDYHAIHIENSQGTGAISGTETAIHFEPNTMAPPGANFDYGIDMEPVAFGTADVRLSSGATVVNPHADTLTITEAVTNFDGGEVLIDNGNLVVADGQKIIITDGTEADSIDIYDDGTNVQFDTDNPIYLSNNLWIPGDTLFFTDGGADTSYIVQSGDYLMFMSDNPIYYGNQLQVHHHILGSSDAHDIQWYGYEWYIDYDDDDVFANIYFHGSNEVLSADSAGQKLWWMGSGGIGIVDAVGGADSARWYDDGTHTIFITDNDFVLSDDVTLGDTINTVFLPKGTRLILADSSGADSVDIYHDGTNLIFDTNEPIKLGSGNVHIAPGDTLYIESATFTAFAIYATGTDLYIFGTGADDIHLQAGDICVDGDLTVDGGIIADNIVTNVCDTVASATIVTLGNYNNFVITGTTDIDSINTDGTMPNWGIAYIQFTGSASLAGLVDGKNLKLTGNFTFTADDIFVLQRRGNIFYEISRSAN